MRQTVELARNALLDKRHISPRAVAVVSRGLAQYVGGVEVASGPAKPAKEDVAVRVQRGELLAQVCQAGAVGWPTTGLGEESLASILPEPRSESLESSNVVGCARGVRAGVVGVEVLVSVPCQILSKRARQDNREDLHIEDQASQTAIRIRDLAQSSGGAVLDEVGGGRAGSPLVRS
jgi:hypothetical protein